MPELEHSVWRPHEGQGVAVYGLHQNEPAQALQDFIEQTGVTFPVLSDQGTLGQLSFPAGTGYPYPRDVIIGKDLTIHSIRNSFNVEEVNALIEQLLDE